MLNKLTQAVYIFLILNFASSCNSKKLINYSEVGVDNVLYQYIKRNQSITSFEANADVTLNYYDAGKLENQKFNAQIFWNNHDSLSIEMNYGVLGFNLADVAKMFVGPENYIFVTRDNLFLTGLSNDDYLNKLFRIDIPLKQWAPKLFLCALTYNKSEFKTELTDQKLVLNNKTENIIFRTDIALPYKYIYSTDSNTTIEVTYESEFFVDDYVFPARIVYYNKIDQSETIIEYKSIKLNKPLPKKGFEVKIPSQMEQIIYE